MHNCRTTREHITELFLSSDEPGPGETIECDECKAEFESLVETLRRTRRSIEATTPSKEDWSTYSISLRRKLADATATVGLNIQAKQSIERENWLKRWLRSSIRVPVPVGVAIVLLFAASLFIAIQRSRKTEVVQTVSTVQVPIEIPVVQERVITRIVYRQAARPAASRQVTPKPGNTAIAKAPVTLNEFKPLDEVKFKIIKGGSPDEK